MTICKLCFNVTVDLFQKAIYNDNEKWRRKNRQRGACTPDYMPYKSLGGRSSVEENMDAKAIFINQLTPGFDVEVSSRIVNNNKMKAVHAANIFIDSI